MLRIEYVYWLCGAILIGSAWLDFRAGRRLFGTFWAILAIAFVFGDRILADGAAGNRLPEQLSGVGVLALGIIAGSGRLHRTLESTQQSATRKLSAQHLGNWLFFPALMIPFGTLVLLLTAPYLQNGGVGFLDPKQASLAALGVACLVAMLAAARVTRSRPARAMQETGRLLNALSWAALLPILLAMLGAVFAATGVGDAVAHLLGAIIPTDSRSACLMAYVAGMVVFTMIMGNAFAAFPVMAAGVGVPLLIGQHHANAAVIGALGMLCGYCGTLVTPMAANFNMVPVALLDLRDPNSVIRAQWPTALALLAVNVVLLQLLAFA